MIAHELIELLLLFHIKPIGGSQDQQFSEPLWEFFRCHRAVNHVLPHHGTWQRTNGAAIHLILGECEF